MALTPIQEHIAAIVPGLPEARGFVLAGGAAMAAHSVLHRTTRDLDYFGALDAAAAVHQPADTLEAATVGQGLRSTRDREWHSSSACASVTTADACEVDLAIDYRALEPVSTRYGPALELRELGTNKVS